MKNLKKEFMYRDFNFEKALNFIFDYYNYKLKTYEDLINDDIYDEKYMCRLIDYLLSQISKSNESVYIFSSNDQLQRFRITSFSKDLSLNDMLFLSIYFYYLEHIVEEDFKLNNLKEILLEKNKKYGNSVLDPLNVFAEKNILHTIHSRIDEKLSRIKASKDNDNEDAILDLMGYLVFRNIYFLNRYHIDQ